jgi:hypothetical protein
MVASCRRNEVKEFLRVAVGVLGGVGIALRFARRAQARASLRATILGQLSSTDSLGVSELVGRAGLEDSPENRAEVMLVLGLMLDSGEVIRVGASEGARDEARFRLGNDG